MLERGQIVFVKNKVALATGKSAIKLELKKPVATMVLGLGENSSEWDDKLIAQALITLGLIYIDDVKDCLGENARKKLIKFLEAKYR
jgi:hypothetical protein